MSEKPSIRKRMRYRFDGYMSRGGGTLFVVLIATMAVFIIMMIGLRLLLSLFLPTGQDAYNAGPIGTAIIAFLQTFDPGFIAGDLPSSRWYIGSAVLAGVGGIILVALLTALLVTALEQRFTQLRKGQSQVVESDHTLILGWDEQRVVEIIKELSIANEKSRSEAKSKRHVVVVLADRDKTDMDDYVRRHLKETKNTRVVTRSGQQWSTTDLEMVSVLSARSAVILSECNYSASDASKEQADARVIKTLLALESCGSYSDGFHVVAELFNGKSRKASSMIGLGNVVAPNVKTIIARILLQTSRSVGLSVVYDELFSFRGAEFYLVDPKSHAGAGAKNMTFRKASATLTGAIAVGIVRNVGGSDSEHVEINPDPDCGFDPGDLLIVIAGDDSEIGFSGVASPPQPRKRKLVESGSKPVESLLLVGWGPKTLRFLKEYGKYVDSASTVHIMMRTDPEEDSENTDPIVEINEAIPDTLQISVISGDPTDPDTWCGDAVVPRTERPHNPIVYDHIVILSDGDRMVSADVVDAKTITILLLLRDAIKTRGRSLIRGQSSDRRRTTVVTELVESDNQVIAPDIGLHDFVVSSRVVSMLFAEFVQDPRMMDIYMSLFQESGSEIYIKPISWYEQMPSRGSKRLRFIDLMTLANRNGEICIGLKIDAEEDDPSKNFGVRLLPAREDRFDLVDGDGLVVIAQRETRNGEAPDTIAGTR